MKKSLAVIACLGLLTPLLLAGCEDKTQPNSPTSSASANAIFPTGLSSEDVYSQYVKPVRVLLGEHPDWSDPAQLDVDKVLVWSFFIRSTPTTRFRRGSNTGSLTAASPSATSLRGRKWRHTAPNSLV